MADVEWQRCPPCGPRPRVGFGSLAADNPTTAFAPEPTFNIPLMLWLAPGAGKASRPTQHIGNEADRRTVDDTEFFQAGRWPGGLAGGGSGGAPGTFARMPRSSLICGDNG